MEGVAGVGVAGEWLAMICEERLRGGEESGVWGWGPEGGSCRGVSAVKCLGVRSVCCE